MGYIPFDPEAANLMFSLVSARYERASLIVTSNKPFSAWGEIFGDEVVAVAMIDRLVHHAEIVSLKGDSYRLPPKRQEPRCQGEHRLAGDRLTSSQAVAERREREREGDGEGEGEESRRGSLFQPGRGSVFNRRSHPACPRRWPTFQPALTQVIERLGQLDFPRACENVILLGPPRTGKTHLAIALRIRACLTGQRVLFCTATERVALLTDAQRQGRLEEELRRLERYPLLACDEVGYIPFDRQAANLMFMLTPAATSARA